MPAPLGNHHAIYQNFRKKTNSYTEMTKTALVRAHGDDGHCPTSLSLSMARDIGEHKDAHPVCESESNSTPSIDFLIVSGQCLQNPRVFLVEAEECRNGLQIIDLDGLMLTVKCTPCEILAWLSLRR